jgi:hypothetical protein
LVPAPDLACYDRLAHGGAAVRRDHVHRASKVTALHRSGPRRLTPLEPATALAEPDAATSVAAILRQRLRDKVGPDPIAARLAMPASTVHRVLVRHDLSRLSQLDRQTATPIRRTNESALASSSTFT